MNSVHYPQRQRNTLCFRQLTVLSVASVGEGFRRLIVGGEQLDDFVSAGFDDHVKLFFPSTPSQFVPPQMSEEGLVWQSDERPPTRDYTPIYDAARRELTLDIYLHQDGVASAWAKTVKNGDPVFIGGPRGSLVVPVDYPWQLYVCDESGMPALRQRLQALRAAGIRHGVTALVNTHDARCRHYLDDLSTFPIEWFSAEDPAPLAARLAELAPLTQNTTPFVWIVGEGRQVKQWAAPFEQQQMDERLLRAVAYWHAKN